MGKRIELGFTYRKPVGAPSGGKVVGPVKASPAERVAPAPDAGPGAAAAAIVAVMRDQVVAAHAQVIEDAIVALARKRALKAAQMKRYRDRKRPK